MRSTNEAHLLPPVAPAYISWRHERDSPALFCRRYLCPITREVMEYSVIAADGHSYERAAIEQW